MLVRLIKEKMMVLYPDAKNLDFDNWLLVKAKYRDGSVGIVACDGIGIKYMLGWTT